MYVCGVCIYVYMVLYMHVGQVGGVCMCLCVVLYMHACVVCVQHLWVVCGGGGVCGACMCVHACTHAYLESRGRERASPAIGFSLVLLKQASLAAFQLA